MILPRAITLFIAAIVLSQFFGCAQDRADRVQYLQSDAHKNNDAPYSQAVNVGDMLYL